MKLLKTKRVAVTLAAIFCLTAAVHAVIVIDRERHDPVINAVVFDCHGHNVGSTDASGRLPDLDKGQYPLTLRHMSYLPVTVNYGTDTVTAETLIYNMPEIEYTGGSDYLLMTAYVRMFYTLYDISGKLRDTTNTFTEGIIQYLLPMKRLKKVTHRTVTTCTYIRSTIIDPATKEHRDTFSISRKEPRMLEMFIEMPSVPSMLFEKVCRPINLNSSRDLVEGKYGPRAIWKRDKEFVSIQLDALAEKKDHKYCPWYLKMMGMTVEATDMIGTELYRARTDNKYTMRDFISFSGLLRLDIKGRMFKTVLKDDMRMRLYVEIYATDYEYLSSAKAKEWEKSSILDHSTPVVAPSFVPPIDAPTRLLMERARQAGPVKDSADDSLF